MLRLVLLYMNIMSVLSKHILLITTNHRKIRLPLYVELYAVKYVHLMFKKLILIIVGFIGLPLQMINLILKFCSAFDI